MPGVLFCNRKLADAKCRIVDLAPTILDLFGVEPPAYMDGRVLAMEQDREKPPPAEVKTSREPVKSA